VRCGEGSEAVAGPRQKRNVEKNKNAVFHKPLQGRFGSVRRRTLKVVNRNTEISDTHQANCVCLGPARLCR
jgi:hypothetical protein